MEQVTTGRKDRTSRHVSIKTIFISRNLSPGSVFAARLSQQGYNVTGESLIKISPIRFTHTPPTQWIFFSSKNAIRHFFTQSPAIAPGTKFGIMGKASAECLEGFGYKADFIGEGTDVAKIGHAFSEMIGSESVLFPQAIDSLRSIQKHISFRNITYDLYVYKTSIKADFEVPNADVLVFTSPSNVSAYCSKQQFRAGQRTVAIGKSTLTRLKESGAKNITLAPSFDEEGLAEGVLQAVETQG